MKVIYRSIVSEMKNYIDRAEEINRTIERFELTGKEMSELNSEISGDLYFPNVGKVNLFMGIPVVGSTNDKPA